MIIDEMVEYGDVNDDDDDDDDDDDNDRDDDNDSEEDVNEDTAVVENDADDNFGEDADDNDDNDDCQRLLIRHSLRSTVDDGHVSVSCCRLLCRSSFVHVVLLVVTVRFRTQH